MEWVLLPIFYNGMKIEVDTSRRDRVRTKISEQVFMHEILTKTTLLESALKRRILSHRDFAI